MFGEEGLVFGADAFVLAFGVGGSGFCFVSVACVVGVFGGEDACDVIDELLGCGFDGCGGLFGGVGCEGACVEVHRPAFRSCAWCGAGGLRRGDRTAPVIESHACKSCQASSGLWLLGFGCPQYWGHFGQAVRCWEMIVGAPSFIGGLLRAELGWTVLAVTVPILATRCTLGAMRFGYRRAMGV